MKHFSRNNFSLFKQKRKRMTAAAVANKQPHTAADCVACRQRRALPMPQCKCPHWQQFKRTERSKDLFVHSYAAPQVLVAWNHCSLFNNMHPVCNCVSCRRICCHAPPALCAPLSRSASIAVCDVHRSATDFYCICRQVCIVNLSPAVSFSTPHNTPMACSTG